MFSKLFYQHFTLFQRFNHTLITFAPDDKAIETAQFNQTGDNMNAKKLTPLVFVLAIMALFAGAVSAQEAPNTPPGNGDRQGQHQRRGHELITVVAEQTGLTEQDILTQVRDGATLAEIITANGGDVDAVIAAVVEEATTRINTAVSESRITQERADEMLANLQENVTSAINGEFQVGRGGGRGGRDGMWAVLDLVVEQTGLTREEVRTQLQAGATVAEILTANDVDVAAFIDSAIALAETQTSEAVAAGRITQEQADARLAQLRERLTDFINNGRPERPAETEA